MHKNAKQVNDGMTSLHVYSATPSTRLLLASAITGRSRTLLFIRHRHDELEMDCE